MNMHPRDAASFGFVFNGPEAPAFRGWIDPKEHSRFARDSALLTAANSGIPAEMAGWIDPRVIEIVTSSLNAREIFGEVKKGDWTSPYFKFRVDELTGSTEPYADFGGNRTSGYNTNWVTREQYLFQTVIQVGEHEEATSALAKIEAWSRKQTAAAHIIDVDANRFYLYGVAGKEIYGILNQPNLDAPIAPLPNGRQNGAANSPLWIHKTAEQIYADILSLFQNLVAKTDGHIRQNSPLKLVMSPAMSVRLGNLSVLGNATVLDMLGNYLKALTVVSLPEMSSEATGETMMLLASELKSSPVGELAFSEKIRAGRVVLDLSSREQKWMSSTYGAVIYQPLGIVQMRGM